MPDTAITVMLGIWLLGFVLALIYALEWSHRPRPPQMLRDPMLDKLFGIVRMCGWIPFINLPVMLLIIILRVWRTGNIRAASNT